MSHFTKIDRANIIDVTAFIAACKELGFNDVKQNTTIKDFYGQSMNVDVAVKVGKYDIALKKNSNGTYDMVADWWGIRGTGLSAKFKGCFTDAEVQDMILKHTTKNTIINKYKKLGFRASVVEDAEQNLQVELVRF